MKQKRMKILKNNFLSDFLIKKRKESTLSLRATQKICGFDSSLINKVENNKVNISSNICKSLAKAYKISDEDKKILLHYQLIYSALLGLPNAVAAYKDGKIIILADLDSDKKDNTQFSSVIKKFNKLSNED